MSVTNIQAVHMGDDRVPFVEVEAFDPRGVRRWLRRWRKP